MEVVILCGGKGTRSYPFTDQFPKAMMPINGSPIIVHLMNIYADQGITRFILAAGHRKEVLRDYFQGRFANWQVQILDTGDDSDTGERLRRCAPYLSETFHVTYVDGLGNVDLRDLTEFHRNSGAVGTVTSVPLRSQYGTIISDQDNRVLSFNEKPVIPDHWINAGFFVFSKQIFDHWPGNNLETDVLPELARRKQLFTYAHHGFWKSMDTSKDQQELEHLYHSASIPWSPLPRSRAMSAD
jgi:glucose-1-phosphate cytidylyltransferase